MMTNDVLRSVRYMLDLADVHVVNMIKLAGYEVSQQDVASWLKKEGEKGFAECPAMSLVHFLDGLIIFRRGKNENAAAERAARSTSNDLSLSNNQVLKKLRVAFELKEDDLNSIMDAAGFKISKPELSALLRKEGQKNYRPCGDQFLRNFLKGLTLRIRG